MGTAARGRRLARGLSSHLHGRRVGGVGKFVLQARGNEERDQGPQPGWVSVTSWPTSRGSATGTIRQELWIKHLQNPVLALIGA